MELSLSTHFTLTELTRSATAQRLGMDNTPDAQTLNNLRALATNVLEPLRQLYGSPIRVTSGYRSPDLNAVVGGAPSSQHMRGQAADITAGTPEENRRLLRENCETLGIPAEQREANIFRYVEKQEGAPCYLCARMRRGYLYKYARELGCNKIALGHHFDDVIETILMSILYGAEVKTMLPKLHSAHYPGMELIRPLYLVKEHDIVRWQNYCGLRFLSCACALEQQHEASGEAGKRAFVKQLIAQLRKENDNVDSNIFHAVEDVNLETLLGYRTGERHTSFLDEYVE